ncbi:DUF6517 family protein [Natranaeroarchaeum aerophilus]|uniref:DUF6517 family protein n=1 Tax=Natranaeroarchaeum aerophilus TaxID=2917711 RepID=A0AAE3FMK5_9EURY|nr:DUF6517 family protein [Natranaeroarchaeum aerophilus]MCL9812387.1 DUF6517 family protein [Natranaeroarchaeum aerophilus]
MNSQRRRLLAASGVALTGGLAGCLGFVTGDEDLEFSSSPGSVSQSALDSTGYGEHEIEEAPIEETFEIGGQSRTVRLTNWHSQYDRAVDLEPIQRFQGAVFSVFSTPKFEIAGRSVNPIDRWDTDRIVGMVQDRYEGLENLQRTGEYTTPMLGAEPTITEYEGRADITGSGVMIDLNLHVSGAVDHGGDFLLGLAVHPDEIPGEGNAVRTLYDGVEHDG